MRYSLGFISAALAFAGQTYALPAQAEPSVPDVFDMRPIALRDYESAFGLRRRDSKPFSELNPSEKANFIYGSPGGEQASIESGFLRS